MHRYPFTNSIWRQHDTGPPYPFLSVSESTEVVGLQGSSALINSKSVGTHRTSHRWSSQDLITLDGLPYVGQMFQRELDLFVATGFSKWGMTNEIAAGTLLADQLTDCPTDSLGWFHRSVKRLNQVISVHFSKQT